MLRDGITKRITILLLKSIAKSRLNKLITNVPFLKEEIPNL